MAGGAGAERHNCTYIHRIRDMFVTGLGRDSSCVTGACTVSPQLLSEYLRRSCSGANVSSSVLVIVHSQTLVKGLVKACWFCWDDSSTGFGDRSSQVRLGLSWSAVVVGFRVCVGICLVSQERSWVPAPHCSSHSFSLTFTQEAIDGKTRLALQVNPSSQGILLCLGVCGRKHTLGTQTCGTW